LEDPVDRIGEVGELGAELETYQFQIGVEHRRDLRDLGLHRVLHRENFSLDALELLVGVGDEAAHAVDHLLLVSKEPLLVQDLGLRLEELVERSPFRRQLLHRREVAALGESRSVAVSRQIFRGIGWL
jgi:hypothetical protein